MSDDEPTTAKERPRDDGDGEPPDHHPIAIVGGGIGGLVLALCLDQAYNHPTTTPGGGPSGPAPPSSRSRLPVHVYESTAAYTANAGGAIGLYSNGLRVLRDLGRGHPAVPGVLRDVRASGCDYLYRRWMRHDGTQVAVAREDELIPVVEVKIEDGGGDDDAEKRADDDDDDDEHSAGSGDTRSCRTTDSLSGSPRQQPQQRPRGNSVSSAASDDREGERADRRPRGGSFGRFRDSFENLAALAAPAGTARGSFGNLRAPLSKSLTTPATGGTGDSADSNAEWPTSAPTTNNKSRGSMAHLRGALQTLVGSNAKGPMSGDNRPSVASTDTSDSTKSPRMVETELLSMGIRRWKYQQVLYEACLAAGIHIHFGKRLQHATSIPASGGEDCKTLLHFKDGSRVTTSLLIGADGINSKARNYVANPSQKSPAEQEEFVPEYTGVTCLMGCANVPRIRGICFPSSATTRCHACYYPTRAPREGTGDDPSDYEQVFQIYFPSPVERPDTWRTLTPQEAKEECRDLAKRLRKDGWDEEFLRPLEHPTLTGVLRVGLRSREGLESWHVGGNENGVGEVNTHEGVLEGNVMKENVGRAVLLGDAAHPPVPYIGQGAMMAMEDAGTLAMLLGHYCPIVESNGNDGATTSPTMLDFAQFSKAMSVYESLRVSRTKTILGSSVQLGKTQQKRAESKLYNAWREMSIKAQVWAYGTLPVMRPGAAFDYRVMVEEALLADAEGCGEEEVKSG